MADMFGPQGDTKKPVKLDPMSDRLRGEVQNTVMTAGAIDPQVAGMFYEWAEGEIHEDAATRQAVGLELIDDYKAARPDLFKPTPPAAPESAKKIKRIVVDEEREVNVAVGISSYTFRPGQTITDPYILDLAKQHKIALREK